MKHVQEECITNFEKLLEYIQSICTQYCDFWILIRKHQTFTFDTKDTFQ